ncbi:CDP-alcohol phosphatidyltransferase family protein [Cryobacterium sp. TMT1-3]|uniref:CDP-alcohol phosphatidyltransferase family protein n=1 Tax=Cryobacterium luteum TaxID=1424661 RepID=A0A1H8LS08_9MICO|nr:MULTISPECIES: CDP-alcohol phosphatidyltransferase family protein [Cryobacterium]TFB82413.1 CDP-alcohol phosphatidyltransferase family protein [Cryobacterium luteum]TFC30449.1 CDP-alcohol phosphatidyltransferase family protein [Cryobacterium sp. TMT1-3]SEO07932.1 cardiolipin synthase [Cryobacterium luteum]
MNTKDRTLRPRPEWWTIPNLVTVIRFVLIVPIVALLLSGAQPITAATLTVLFGATDWVDGFLARRLGQETRLGEILDPIADRLGIGCLGIALTIIGAIPWSVIIVILFVDLIVGSVSLTRHRNHQLSVTWIGKIRTALIMISASAVTGGLIPGMGLVFLIGQVGLVVGALLHIFAGVGYLRQLLRGDAP